MDGAAQLVVAGAVQLLAQDALLGYQLILAGVVVGDVGGGDFDSLGAGR